MSLSTRMDQFQRRHRWAGLPIAVAYKFFDDQGSYLAALIAYYGLVSLFPLLLLLTSVLGFVLQGNPALQERIVSSALSEFPVIGTEISAPSGLRGSGIALVVGAVGAVYGSSGIAQAVQHAMNVAWAVPRNVRPNPFLSRLRGLVLLGTASIALAGATVLTALTTELGGPEGHLGTLTTVLGTGLAVALNAGVLFLAFRVSTAHPLTWREALPGAVIAAVLWQLLQSAGTGYIQHVIRHSSLATGTFAFVLALIAWLYLAAASLVISVEINVVLNKRLYPRALLTPFTDHVDLTQGDRRAYADAARAQRNKGFETVHVTFETPPSAVGDDHGVGADADEAKTVD